MHADVTIALPLLVSALAASARETLAARKPLRFDLSGPIDGGQRPPVSTSAFRGPRSMSFPFDYDHGAPLAFGGALPEPAAFDDSQIVILPIPVDRTTSYVGGTRNGPREILQASSHMELWDEEVGVDVHRRRHLHAAGDGAAVRRDGAADGRDRARRIRDRAARQVSRCARRRAFDHGAARRRDRCPSCGRLGPADRRARRSARRLHGNAAQPRLRDAPHARVRARDAGRHPQHVYRGSRSGAAARAPRSSTTCR